MRNVVASTKSENSLSGVFNLAANVNANRNRPPKRTRSIPAAQVLGVLCIHFNLIPPLLQGCGAALSARWKAWPEP